MKLQNTLKLIAACAIALGTASTFAHGDETHASNSKAVKKEQKAWGISGDAAAVKRSITLVMSDNMRFTPDRIDVKQGETIRFVLKNEGQVLHEMVLGTRKDLEAHAAMMQKFPAMAHEKPGMAHIGPGKTGEIIWTFNRPGSFDFACLIAGHYQAGMTGKITVAAAR